MMLSILTTLVMLQLIVVPAWSGPAEDAALLEAAHNLDIIAVTAALKKGANPHATSPPPTSRTPLQMVTWGMHTYGLYGGRDAHSKALEVAKVLFSNGAKLGVLDRDILFVPILVGNVQLVSLLLDRGAS